MIARSRVVPVTRLAVRASRGDATRSPVRVRARTCADLVATRALSAVIEVDMVNIVFRPCVRAGSADSDSARGIRCAEGDRYGGHDESRTVDDDFRGGHDESRTVDDDFRPCSTSKKARRATTRRVRRSIARSIAIAIAIDAQKRGRTTRGARRWPRRWMRHVDG